jgi:hypothetical protein
VVIIPLWKFEEQAVRAALILAAPSLATAVIQNFGKLLGVYIGPGADRRQWLSVREELRSRSRFLASLGLAWGGVLPLYRSHVLPVACHVAQMARLPAFMLRAEASCHAIVLKAPYRALPIGLLRSGRSFGLDYDITDLATMAKAATFRAAESSVALVSVLKEHARARKSRYSTLSPFLRSWTKEGVVGHLRDNQIVLRSSFDSPIPVGRGLQAWVSRELRKKFNLDPIYLIFTKRLSEMVGSPISFEVIRTMRLRLKSLQGNVPHVVQSSLIRSICNAWTTSGRFTGPRAICPFGCGAERGDRWAHFPYCPNIRRMWGSACPMANPCFAQLTLEQALILSSDLTPDDVVQVALWTDVVGHCANDIRATSATPSSVSREGDNMMRARLRFLAVQSEPARTVITRIRAASM